MSNKTTLLFIGILSTLLTSCTLATEPIPAGPIETGPLPGEDAALAALPDQQPDLSNGAAIYVDRCAACHGLDGAGNGELADQIQEQGGRVGNLTDPDLVYSKSPQDWYDIITNGNIQALMPPWQEALTEQERWDVAYYLYTLSADQETLANGQALYEQFGDDYGARGGDAPFVELEEQATLSREAIIDTYFAEAELTLEEAQELAAYVQTFALDEQAATVASDPSPSDTEAAEEPSEAAAENRGTVEGVITNVSAGTLPADLEVRLNGVIVGAQGDITEFLVRAAPVESDGSYSFEDVPIDVENGAYITSVFYQGVEYNNGSVLEAGVTDYTLPIEVYESTTDPAVVEIERLNVVVREEENALFVFQVWQYSNTSDAVYVTEDPLVGGRRGSVAFQLPRDAFSVEFGDGVLGGRYIVEEDGTVFDTTPLFPGEETKSILVTYFVPFEGSRDVPITAEYQINEVVMLLEEGPNFRVDSLMEGGVEVLEGVAYQQFSGADISAGEVLLFRVQPGVSLEENLPLFIATAILILVAAGVVYRLVWGVPDPVMPRVKASVATYNDQQQALARQIAELDVAYKTGSMERYEYEAQRSRLKAKLIDSMS